MKIEWLGLSCFRIRAGGASVVIDPYSHVRGYGDVHTTAGMVLKSHEHGDHAYLAGVNIEKQPIEVFHVTQYASFHDDEGGKLRGQNTIHVIEAEGKRVAHLGDLGHLLDTGTAAALRGVDVLLIPVGGFYTIDAMDAKAVADAVAPKVVVPMHYREGAYGHEVIGTLEEFLRLYTPDYITRLETNAFEADTVTGVVVPRYPA